MSAPTAPVDEKTAVELQIAALKAQLDYLNQRLKSLGGEEEGDQE